jgi:hypothetical protein
MRFAGFIAVGINPMTESGLIFSRDENQFMARKPDILPDERWRSPMKAMILVALAVLSLSAGVANAQSFSHEMPQQHGNQSQG